MPLAVVALLLVIFSFTTGEFVIAGILPDVATNLSVSIPAAGLLVTAYALGMIAGGPIVTVLTSRLPRKPLIVGLIAISVTANLGSAAAPAYPVLLVSRVAAGLVVATFFAVAITTAISMAPADKPASTVAKLTLGMNLGIILGAPGGTFVGHHLGWRATFLTIAAVSVAGLLLVLRFIPTQPAAATGTTTLSALAELRVFADRDVQLAIVLTALGNVGVVTVFTYIAPLLTDISGFTPGTIPALLLVYGAGAIVGNFLGGWLADKALLPSLTGLLTVLAGTLTLFWILADSRVPAAMLTFVIGALAFAIIPGMQTRVVATASAAPTLAVAVNASGFQVAAAFAGWLGGQVISSPLGLRSIALVGALLTVAGLTIAVYSLRRDRRHRPTPASHAL